MKKQLRILYWSIEINLILWMMIFGFIGIGGRSQMSEKILSYAKTIALIGVLFSAIIQHWAYYHVRKELKK